jgi:hypothetical protein
MNRGVSGDWSATCTCLGAFQLEEAFVERDDDIRGFSMNAADWELLRDPEASQYNQHVCGVNSPSAKTTVIGHNKTQHRLMAE